MTDTYNPGQEAVAITANPNVQAVQARHDPNGSVNALVRALGSDTAQQEVTRVTAEREERKKQEQALKIDAYTEQFMKDHQGGAVSQVQVKARYPEMVPVIASRVAESIGKRQGEKDFATVVERINADDSLRLDTAKRNTFIAAERGKLFSAIPQGNEFYANGVVGAMDKLIREQELKWQGQTAAFHQQVQEEALSKEAVDALNSVDPKAALETIDANWSRSSSLNNLERNKIVVRSAIDLAFVNDDHTILSAVPDRFLNADSKAALEQAKVQLTARRMSALKQARELEEIRRAEALRSAKVELVQAAVAGQRIDPGKYRDDPEAFQFALQMREAPRLDESTSRGNVQLIRSHILQGATVGTGGTLGDLTDKIVGNPNLNPKDRQALLDELPKLIEGRNLMEDEDVRQPIRDFLRPALDALGRSPSSAIQSLVAGQNLEMQVMRGFQRDLQTIFMAEFEETGAFPKGHRKRELIRLATDRAEARLEKLTRLTKEHADVAPTMPSGSSSVSTSPLPRGVRKLD